MSDPSETFRTVRVDDRGQIVLPEEVCCDLRIAGDTVLVLVQRGNEIVLRKEEDVLRELETGWQHLGRAALESTWDDEDEVWEDHTRVRVARALHEAAGHPMGQPPERMVSHLPRVIVV